MRIPDFILFNSKTAIKSTIADLKCSSIFIIADSNTEKYCLPEIHSYLPDNYTLITISDDENDKNISSCTQIWSKLLSENADRNSLIINLGGGLVSDLGGFSASVFKRGIRYINIPTTLLSMVDAAFGGKTGVNLNQFKNQIGVFSQPDFTFVFTDFLKTQDKRQLLSGFGEILKYGLGFDEFLWHQLENIKNPEIEIINEEIIRKCISLKLGITDQDPFEKNIRKLLNLGHTCGHSFESYFMNSPNFLLHGEAVAWGLVAESLISFHSGYLNAEELDFIINLVSRHFTKPQLDRNSIPDLIEIMKNDKKNISDNINFTLPLSIGHASENIFVDTVLISKSLNEFIEL